MDNNQFFTNPQNSNKKIFQWIGLGCSCGGFLLTIIFSIITCARGFKASTANVSADKFLSMSHWIWGVVAAIIVTIVGLVFTILSIEKGQKLAKITLVSLAVAVCAIAYGVITNATICTYGCTYNCNYEKEMDKLTNSWFD